MSVEPGRGTTDPLAAIDDAAGLTRIAGGDPETIALMRLSMRMFTRQAGVSPRLRELVEAIATP